MRAVINILLLVIIVGLGYLLYDSIKEPIVFQTEKKKREDAVANKLRKIRVAQQFYRDIRGMFADDFDTLAYVLRNDSFMSIKVSGDPDAVTGEYLLDTFYRPAFDTIQKLGWSLDSLRYVPYAEAGTTFEIQADTIRYQQSKTPVVQVGIVREKFMGKYGDPSYAKYDDRYDPKALMKFGNMTKPSLSGNWE